MKKWMPVEHSFRMSYRSAIRSHISPVYGNMYLQGCSDSRRRGIRSRRVFCIYRSYSTGQNRPLSDRRPLLSHLPNSRFAKVHTLEEFSIAVFEKVEVPIPLPNINSVFPFRRVKRITFHKGSEVIRFNKLSSHFCAPFLFSLAHSCDAAACVG